MNIFKKALKLIFIQLPLVPFVAAAATASSSAPGIDLSITSLFGILSGLACWMSRFVIIIMTIVIIWYGLQFLLSRGNPKAFEDAKKSLWYGIIGIVVVLGAYTIIATVGNAVEAAGGNGGQVHWTNFLPIDCTNYNAVTGSSLP